MKALAGKRLAFWLAVGGVSVLSQFGLEVLSDRVPSLGLAKFTNYSHRGGPTA